jgi:O-antigen/teichoic acid export membrane protein
MVTLDPPPNRPPQTTGAGGGWSMYRRILSLGKHTLIYGLGSVGTRLLGFLLIPVYTRFMSPADYGVLALCTTTAAVLQILSTAGIPSAVLRTYLLTADTDEKRDRVLGTAVMILGIVGIVILVLLLGSRATLAQLIFGSEQYTAFVVLIAILNFVYLIEALRNANFRMREQSGRYTFFTLLAFFVNLGLGLWLVVGLRLGAWGAMLANTLTVVAIAALFLPWALRQLRRGFAAWAARDLLGFGLPLIPVGLSTWIMNLSDIYILRIFRTQEEIGLYNLGYKFGLGIYLLTNAFKLAFPQVIFTEANRREAPVLFARVATYYCVGLGFLCLSAAIFAPEIILIADARFHSAYRVIPLAVFAYFFFGLISILEVGIDITRKLHWLVVIFLGGAGLNIGLNLLFVPRFGMMAAAWTTLATYVVLPLGVYNVSRRLYPFHLEWSRLAKLAVLMVAVGIGSWLGPFGSLLGNVAWKAALLLAFLPGLVVLKFFTSEETDRLRHLLHRSAD